MPKRFRREKPAPKKPNKSALEVLRAEINRLRGKPEKEKKSVRKPGLKSRSFAPRTLQIYEEELERQGIDSDEAVEDEEFFDVCVGSSLLSKPLFVSQGATDMPKKVHKFEEFPEQRMPKIKKQQVAPQHTSASWRIRSRSSRRADTTDSPSTSPRHRGGGGRADGFVPLADNSERNTVGLGCLEKVFGGGTQSVMSEKGNSRPFFTYWVTIIQLIIFIVVMATYKIAPIGFSTTVIEETVLTPSLTTQKVSRVEKDNLWIGPTQQSLIHLGAKYSPCMREDTNIDSVLNIDKVVENQTACCVNNDGSGCLQTTERECNTILSTFDKWSGSNPGYRGRTSGPVCGQDPRICESSEPINPSEWPDDITEWPVCTQNSNNTMNLPHMECELVGRPCCVGIQAECIITTREYCDFRNGYFHDEATLCSQVKCMGEICGMLPFSNEDKPDQFYRFFTSLFLHSGVLTMVLTLVIQLLMMRELEIRIGTFAIFVIYLGGGLVGGAASATFIPYYVETGPTGSQLAVLGALFVEVVRWNTDERRDNPGQAFGKIIGVILILFFFGLILVDVNNWSNIFGMFYGVCVALVFRPIKKYKGRDVKSSKVIGVRVVCSLLAIIVLVILIVLFYVIPIKECDSCMYFNCIPFNNDYCEGMSVSISRNASAES